MKNGYREREKRIVIIVAAIKLNILYVCAVVWILFGLIRLVSVQRHDMTFCTVLNVIRSWHELQPCANNATESNWIKLRVHAHRITSHHDDDDDESKHKNRSSFIFIEYSVLAGKKLGFLWRVDWFVLLLFERNWFQQLLCQGWGVRNKKKLGKEEERRKKRHAIAL